MSARSVRRDGPFLLAAVVLLAAVWLDGARAAGPLPPLTGPPLAGATHLRLIVGDTPPVIFNVDTGRIATVPGVVPAPAQAGGPRVAAVVPARGGAFLTVWDGRAYTGFFVSAQGGVDRLASAKDMLPARNAAAVWTLTGAARGRCGLRLVPSERAAVDVPCGNLLLDSPLGVAIGEGGNVVVVAPSTGRVVRRIRASGQLAAINTSGGSFLLSVSGNSQSAPGKLTLINLATGAQRRLLWPSALPWVQRVTAEPHGPLVAVGFVSPAYPGPQQANDVWLLDPATGTFTHLPGFPAQESVKFSNMAWTSTDRLVVIAQSIAGIAQDATRTVLAIWQPGQTTLPLRRIQTFTNPGGFSQFAAIAD